MIARILQDLRAQDHFEVVHLLFLFTRDVHRTRRAGLDKILQLFVVLWRLARVRASGAIDAFLYPVGGPQLVPLIRDACLLPWILLTSRKVILHFHAGGIAETIDRQPLFLRGFIRFLYGKCAAAIVMTQFGRRDAEKFGIHDVRVVPHALTDTYDPARVQRAGSIPQILYVGHLSQEKGTPILLEAFAAMRRDGVVCRLELVGEHLPTYSSDELEASIARLGIQNVVKVSNALSGEEKWDRFAKSDLFVFPSLAPESFGLVTVEAMMWALPVVLFDWRGNREVVGESFGGICVDPGPNPASALRQALKEAVSRREEWPKWGKTNRQFFEDHYEAKRFSAQLAGVLQSILES